MQVDATARAWVREGLHLLPESLVVKTGPVDYASWNYRGALGYIQRRRFHLVRRALGGARFPRLLELGYGSGVFQPELARHCDRLFGLDVHDKPAEVAAGLARVGVRSRLVRASTDAMPYPSAHFDAVVAVSALEFFSDLEGACREVVRVLRPGGLFIAVSPGKSPILDLGLKLLTGQSAERDFGDRRERERVVLLAHFRLLEERTFPALPVPGLRVYTLLKLTPRASA